MTVRGLPPIIGLIGRAQHGKNTVGDYLVENFGYTPMGFSDGVKDAALALDPMVYHGLFDNRLSTVVEREGWELAKRNHPEIRRILQVLGTEVGREMFGSDVWIKQLARRLAAMPVQPVVVTDLRFRDEGAFIRDCGGEVWRIVRYDVRNGSHVLFDNGLRSKHSSEDLVDAVYAELEIRNDDTIESLYQKLGHYCLERRGQLRIADIA